VFSHHLGEGCAAQPASNGNDIVGPIYHAFPFLVLTQFRSGKSAMSQKPHDRDRWADRCAAAAVQHKARARQRQGP
jgi:hypothetical protein